MEAETCTAVMVTGKSPERRPLAKAAMDAFLNQTYSNKYLLIVNDGEPIRNVRDPRIVEVRPKPGLSLGELRNIALEMIAGGWILQWDDDDIHHPKRMEYQMSFRRPGKCQLLLSQLRADTETKEAFKFIEPFGIAGTILHPVTDARYPVASKGEDSYFWEKTWGFSGRQLLDNRGFPEVYLRLYHGQNTWDREHIMKGIGSYGLQPSQRLNNKLESYVTAALSAYQATVS